MSNEMVEVTVTILRDRGSENAILVEYDGNEIWIPRSQIECDLDEGETGEILLAEWKAEEEDMI